jgi:hypothetical protein
MFILAKKTTALLSSTLAQKVGERIDPSSRDTVDQGVNYPQLSTTS